MQVRSHLRLIRVLAVVVDVLDELVVAVCSTRSWSRCPHCGLRCRGVHDTRLLVDKTSMCRRHRYVTVLQNGEPGEVLAMVAHRDEAALSGFPAAQGRRWCAGRHPMNSRSLIY